MATITPLGFKNWKRNVSINLTGSSFSFWFDDLENDLEVVEGIDESKIKICTEKTCGNKVMCFEYEGKIWKEGRKSMNYNRDYCVLDECKEVFGLEKIGMKRVLSNFRIEKIDKSKKSWKDNWHKVIIGEDEEKEL